MKDFDHENILNLLGVVIDGLNAYVVLPYMENGDLKRFICNEDNVSIISTIHRYVLSTMETIKKKHTLSTCVAQSVKGRTSDLDVTGSRPPVATKHYTLCAVNSPIKLNLRSWLLIYLCNK